MSRLTFKQRKFVQEYVKSNGNGQQSAMKIYDTNSLKSAGVIASQNLNKLSVKEELDKLLRKEEYNINKYTNKLTEISLENPIKGYTGSDIIEANKTMLKLHGVLTDRKLTTNVNIDAHLSNLSKYELIQLHKKKKKDIDNIIDGEEISKR